MYHAQLVERVRQIVRDAFVDRGAVSLEDLCETILIRDGYYCGRCFTCGDLKAVWFIEENLIKFSSRQSGMLFTCSAGPVESKTSALVA